MNKLSSQDRAALIKLASSLPAGSPERKAILAGLNLTGGSKTAGFDYDKPIEGKMDYSDMKAEYRRFALSKARLLAEAHNRMPENQEEAGGQPVEVDSLFIAETQRWSGGVSFDIQDGASYTMDVTLTFGKFTANFT